MTTDQIRSQFLAYFKSKGHTVVDSASLVPQNDPTILFTVAGMTQFKDVFLGKDPRPYTRAATAQKCVRAGGKHNDLENVGFTARHHTFFEMLGNFSFGDYFKKEAIAYAWEFITQELKLPKEKLYVTVFREDDEAANIWHKQEGVALDRIYRFDEKDNFWSMGDTGPCGPCSEIYFDRGPKYGQDDFVKSQAANEDRYMEFWNLVFMQFDRDASGKLNPLPKPSVDTGAGLERLASILQEVDTNYDTDAFSQIIAKTSALLGKPYQPNHPSAASFRVIADHARAATFLIGDGVMPSNEGRGYVLRRILRRAIRHGKNLGFTGPFMNKTAAFVIDQMKGTYPDLIERQTLIERAILAEEEQFLKTLEKGIALLDEALAETHGSQKTLSGEIAFKLYDSFGFPLDLTRVICTERGFKVDEKGFTTAMDRQRMESRKNWKGSGQATLDEQYLKVAGDLKAHKKLPHFVGYDSLSADGEVLAIWTQSDQGLHSVDQFTTQAPQASSDSSAQLLEVVFSKTPFYGESGGQVGDRGRVTNSSGFEAEVLDVQRPVDGLIVATLKPIKGTIKKGENAHQQTDTEVRALTARNHTATHLLHWALRKVLGTHVKQGGSIVTSELLRFDFAHFQALTASEVQEIENLVNQRIWQGYSVSKKEMPKDEAIAAGAIAMFGEKYADVVRVINVGDFSVELCGGTHVDHSGEIHLFKVISEAGIAAGTRRIIAMTSQGAFDYLKKNSDLLLGLKSQFKAATSEETLTKISRLLDHEKELKRQIEQFHSQAAAAEVNTLMASAITGSQSQVKLISGVCQANEQGMKKIREMADMIKAKEPMAMIVLGIDDLGGKANLIVAAGSEALKVAGVHSGDLLKQIVGAIDGKGGGKADGAQAGGTKPQGLSTAIESAKKIFSQTL
jgi:alanyl-tRNA synthetase